MKVKEMIAYLSTLPDDAEVIVREWSSEGPKYFRPRRPLGAGVLETDKQTKELCAVVGLFDDCLADRVLLSEKRPDSI